MEEHFKNFFEMFPYGIIETNPSGRIVLCNKKAAEITGYSRNEILSMFIVDFYKNPEDLQKLLHKPRNSNQVYECELAWKTKKNKLITVSLSSWVIQDKKGNISGYQFIFRDITEERKIERCSKELTTLNIIAATISQSPQLKEILSMALDRVLDTMAIEAGGVYLLDEKTQEMVLQVHRGLSSDFVSRVDRMKIGIEGFTKSPLRTGEILIVEDVSKDPIISSVVPAEEGIRSLAIVLLKSKDKILGTMNIASRRYRHFDQEEVRLLESIGNQIGVAIENAQLYQQMRESEEKYRTLFEHSGTAVAIADRDTTLIMVNKKFEELSGYSKEEIEGKISSFQFVAEEDKDRILQYHWQRMINPHNVPTNYEYTFVKRNGERRRVNQSVNLIPGTARRIASIIDVTEQKELQRKLFESRQLAAIGELAAAIAHEIKNPLGAIKTSAAVLRNELRFSEENKELLNIIAEECARLNAIIDDFLRFARPQEPQFRETDVNDLLRETLLLMRDNLGDKIHKNEVLAKDLPKIAVDPDQIKQVFINLILNAVEAMPKGGVLTVSTAVIKDPHPNSTINIVVEDTGLGIEEDKLPKIFQPFYSTKQKGTGMGLAISQRIVYNHRGEIRAESEPGKGAKFTVALPINLKPDKEICGVKYNG